MHWCDTEKEIFFFIVTSFIALVQPNPCDNDVNHPPLPPHSRTPFDLDDSFYLLRVLRKTFPRPQFHPSTVSVSHFAGEKSCKYKKEKRKKSKGRRASMSAEHHNSDLPPVFTKSTCKSYLILNHDPNRTPATVVEVRCACRHCHSASGRWSNDCKPIYNYRRMWRRKCDAKTKTYVDIEVLEPLIVGCTCVNQTLQRRPLEHTKSK